MTDSSAGLNAAMSQPAANERLLRLPDVMSMVGLRKTTIYKLIAAGTFPKQIKLGYLSGWAESEVLSWIEAQKQARAA